MPSTTDGMPALSAPRRRSRKNGCIITVLMACFFALFAAAGTGLLWTASVGPMIQVTRAVFWQPVPCTILSSEVIGNDTFRIAIHYEYLVKEQAYTGSRYSFFNLQTSGRGGKEKVVRQFPPGKATTCYVNPSHASESVLNRSVQWDILWGLGGLPFLLVGVIGMFLFYTRNLATRRKTAETHRADGLEETPRVVIAESAAVTTNSSTEYEDDSLRETPDTLELQPESTPSGALITMLMVGLVWNGLTFAFCAVFAKNWMQGKWHFFPDLIMVPFILVGILLIFGIIRAFMALFNPIPVLTLGRQMIPLGGSATLHWRFRGSPRNIRKLTLVLKGIEEARYTRGTDTVTDTAIFHEETILETMETTEMAQGKIEIRIPTDSMHTLTGSKNKVLWKIRFNGAIPRWPDVGSEYSIRVVPHE